MNRLQGVTMQVFQQAQRMSPAARVLCAVVVSLYLLGFAPGVEENTAVTPAYVMPPKVKLWTLLTATFYERRIIFVLLDIFAIVGFSSALHPYWDVKQFALFCVVVGVASLISGVLLSILLYAIFQSVSFLFVSYHGMMALVCGFVVAVKQYHPDSVPLPPPTPPTLRVKHIPLAAIVISFILSLCGVTSYASTWLVFTGVASAWLYLRFFQKNEHGTRGDMSEGFSFATFFPEPIQPALATLGGFVFHVLVSIRVCPKFERTYDVSAPSRINITLPGADRVDAQRRKQRALKALDERLSKTSSQPQQVWPSMDDTGSSQDEQDPISSLPTSSLPLSSSLSSQPPPPLPPPDMVVIESVPGGGDGSKVVVMDTASSSTTSTVPKTDPVV